MTQSKNKQQSMMGIQLKKYVYVTYDPLLEKVVCVHDKPDKWCSVCRKLEKQRRKEGSLYFLEERKRIIRTELMNKLD